MEINIDFVFALLSAGISCLTIIVPTVLLFYKTYYRIRSRYDIEVNCWFCNGNSRVPFPDRNGWTCRLCEQYNGFTKDGSYNKEIYQQHDCSALSNYNSSTSVDGSVIGRFARSTPTGTPSKNGFCGVCNEAQRWKIEKLSQFEPKNEGRFEEELKVYKEKLEEEYALCSECNRHLKLVLHEKKKMVLGSKFLDFIIKGAERLKQPHFVHFRRVQNLIWKRGLVFCIATCTIINILCLCSEIPEMKQEQFIAYFGTPIGTHLFIYRSHLLAFWRLFCSYVIENHFMTKTLLFLRTISAMILYSFGLKCPQIMRLNFADLYLRTCPYLNFLGILTYSILDKFRLTHFTFLLLLWSLLAGDFTSGQEIISQHIISLFGSIVTLILLIALRHLMKGPVVESDATVTSFHKMYTEDYLSEDEEDTISLKSRQFNSSIRSNQSTLSGKRGMDNNQCLALPLLQHSIRGNGVMWQQSNQHQSLGRMPSMNSMNGSFRSYNRPSTTTQQYGRTFTMNGRPLSSCTSNIELNRTSAGLHHHNHRPASAIFGMSGIQSMNSLNAPIFNDPSAYLSSPAVTPMHSPLSMSINTVHKTAPFYDASFGTGTEHAHNNNSMLSPSRFSMNCLTSNAYETTNSCFGGKTFGYMSNGADGNGFKSNVFSSNSTLFHEQRGAGGTGYHHMTPIDENMSRASSQSSGFESQNGHMGPQSNTGIDSSYQGDLQSIPHSENEPQITNDGNIGCDGESVLLDRAGPPVADLMDSWSLFSPSQRKSLHSVGRSQDSFNLRRINDELPSIRRGDLLRRWKESQVVA